MMNWLRAQLRRKHVRPWSLSAPILVLLICLPLLSPLRLPLKSQMSDEELARLATVQAIVEQQTFAIEGTDFFSTQLKFHYPQVDLPAHRRSSNVVSETYYSDQAPTFALLLAGPYWVMQRFFNLHFATHLALVRYLLTLIGVTIPVAAAAGMLYRMGRLFELRRPWRAGLALAVVLGSGMISYATVINPYAPAAALLLGSIAILVQVSLVRSPIRSGGYLTSAGFFAALAAAIFPPAIIFTLLFAGVIMVMRWRRSLRVGGVLMYGIGMIPPMLLHLSLSLPITGDYRLGLSSPANQPPAPLPILHSPVDHPTESEDYSLQSPPTFWQQVWAFTARAAAALIGSHGIFTHFPVVILGVFGLGSVMHRHWPATTKMLAIATAAGALVVAGHYIWEPIDFRWGMFALRWYVLFLPLLLFWAGAWIRRPHHLTTWVTAAVLLVFSVIASIIGATAPMPRDGYTHYTVAAAAKNLVAGTVEDTPVMAQR